MLFFFPHHTGDGSVRENIREGFYVGNTVSLAQSLAARRKALINGLLQELQPKIKPLQPASIPAGGTADLLTRISSLTLEDEELERKTTQPESLRLRCLVCNHVGYLTKILHLHFVTSSTGFLHSVVAVTRNLKWP